MEIQSFILGMGAMLVVAFAIGSVFAVVKVIKFGKEFREVQIWINQELEKVQDRERQEKMIIGNQFQEVYRTIDSRLDKQHEKILKEVDPNKEFLQLITGRKPIHGDESVENDTLKSARRIMDKLDNNK